MASDNEWVSTSADYITPRPVGAVDAWTEEAASQATQGRQKLAYAGEAAPPSAIAGAFGLTEGEYVIARRRIIYADDDAVELANTYYPPHIARGTPLADPRKIKGGAVTYLAQLGHTPARVIEDVTARPATEIERIQLSLSERDPVVVIERLTLDSSNRPIQADVMVAPAKLRRLRYEMKVS
ncbi:UTRA domain-containing protein [Streptomyces sp. NPDC007164]|uniref:UTRA domain-containing protein n=1 Tax=Streptomyces sp. NPDC007164 TaxID=3156918 RepID=UPI00340285DC